MEMENPFLRDFDSSTTKERNMEKKKPTNRVQTREKKTNKNRSKTKTNKQEPTKAKQSKNKKKKAKKIILIVQIKGGKFRFKRMCLRAPITNPVYKNSVL